MLGSNSSSSLGVLFAVSILVVCVFFYWNAEEHTLWTIQAKIISLVFIKSMGVLPASLSVYRMHAVPSGTSKEAFRSSVTVVTNGIVPRS